MCCTELPNGRFLIKNSNKSPSYPTVAILVEDLRRQWVALLRLLVSGDVAVHPEPLLLQHGDVYFLEADSIGLQETHHCLLVLLYLWQIKEGKKGGGGFEWERWLTLNYIKKKDSQQYLQRHNLILPSCVYACKWSAAELWTVCVCVCVCDIHPVSVCCSCNNKP